MSGGGGDTKEEDKGGQGTGTTPYGRAPVAQTFQPTLPGFQNALVSQLMGGYGSASNGAGLASLLSGLYKPMTAYSFAEPISTTSALYDKKTNAPISTGNPALDMLLTGQKVGDDDDGGKKKK